MPPDLVDVVQPGCPSSFTYVAIGLPLTIVAVDWTSSFFDPRCGNADIRYFVAQQSFFVDGLA